VIRQILWDRIQYSDKLVVAQSACFVALLRELLYGGLSSGYGSIAGFEIMYRDLGWRQIGQQARLPVFRKIWRADYLMLNPNYPFIMETT